jgi:hypothetical protein
VEFVISGLSPVLADNGPSGNSGQQIQRIEPCMGMGGYLPIRTDTRICQIFAQIFQDAEGLA